MIKLEKTEVFGWEHAIRGMRNPMNSWEKSDSGFCGYDWCCDECPACYADDDDDESETSCHRPVNNCEPMCDYILGPNDKKLTANLAAGGPVHAKYRRMIVVYVDITAPLYWWKEFDTYKVGTVANSCSTMHKIADKEFTIEDFSCEHLSSDSLAVLDDVIKRLNSCREEYLSHNNSPTGLAKAFWWQMIQLLPTSYNQKRTVMMNYEVLAGLYPMRKDHKLDEWHDFCDWIKELPYSEIIVREDSRE